MNKIMMMMMVVIVSEIERKKREEKKMKSDSRTIVAYFILGCAASFLSVYVFIERRERKVKELIVYILQ
jgi:endo-alpha-1,4-polygalactosaminidase (GH114 family)